MGILSTNKKIINLGQGYSAGSGISIDDYVISVTGDTGTTYSAGQNIDIYDDQGQLYISGKDWSADIANASSNAFEQATALIPPEFDPSYISGVVDNKLDSTAFSTVSGDYATTSYVDMSDDLTYNRATAWGNQNLAPLNSVADNSAKWNEIEVYEQNSATYLTAHQEIPSAKWEDASDVVQSNSAQWSENTGDEEVNNAVYNNSATWNDITVYQTNSGTYLTAHQSLDGYLTKTSADTLYQPIGSYASRTDLENVSGDLKGDIDYISGVAITAHQDISNKLDTTAFSTVSGTFLTAHQDLSDYATTGDLNTTSGILSGAIDYVSANAGTNVDTIPVAVISPLVTGFSGESAYLGIESTALNLSSYVPVSAIGVNSQGYVSGISGKNISAYYSRNALTANYANTAGRAYQDRNNNEITSYYQPKLTITGDAGTITSINGSAVGASIPEGWELVAGTGISIVDDAENNQTTISVTAAGGNPEVESYVQTNSASIDDAVSTYQTNSATYLTSHQAISANEWNSVYDTVESNSSTWTGGGTAYTGDAQGALDEVYTNSGKWITSSFNGYIKTTGFKQGITYGTNALYFSANSTGNPGITLYGNQGSAFYKENQLQLTRDGKKISFNIGAAGSTITADAAQTTGDGGIYLWNKNNSAYYNQNGIKLRNSASTASTAFIGYNEITSWNGYATDISYISGVVGDVETLLASL